VRRWVELILDIALVTAAVASVPLAIAQAGGRSDAWLIAADWAVWAVFVLQFTVMLALSKDRFAYVRANWLGPVVVILSFPLLPHVLKIVRLAGLTQLLRLLQVPATATRGARALRKSLVRPGLIGVGVTAAFLVLVGGGLLAALEPDTVRGGFWSGLWWAMETVTTVGYGDIIPQSTYGRLVAVGLMLTGIGVVATLAGAIATYFLGQGNDLASLADRLRRLERKLDALAESRGDGSPSIPRPTPPAAGGRHEPGSRR
jgi:voltage-gated potassium channel